jgi:hypothetical protein
MDPSLHIGASSDDSEEQMQSALGDLTLRRPPAEAEGAEWQSFIGAYEAYADIEALDARTARQWGARSAFMSYLQAYRASALYLQAKRDGNEEDRQRSLALVAQSLERAPENEIALSLAAEIFAANGRDYEARELKAKAYVLALEHADAAKRAGEPEAVKEETRAAAAMAESSLINGMNLGQRKEVAANANLRLRSEIRSLELKKDALQ